MLDHGQDFRAGIGSIGRAHRTGIVDAAAVSITLQALCAVNDEEVVQQKLKAVLFEDPITQHFPPPAASHRQLCRAVLAEVENGTITEVEDNLYSACVAALAQAVPSHSTGFDGHMVLELQRPGEMALLVLRVSSSMGQDLDTGGKVWSAGCALLGLIVGGHLDHIIAGSVLELGAGTGILGLGLALRGAPVTNVTLTDGQPSIVSNLAYNVDATRTANSIMGTQVVSRMLPVDVQHLDWSCEEVPLWKWTIDVVVGGDVVYDPSALPALASVLAKLLQPKGSAQTAVIAAAERSEHTVNTFFEALAHERLEWQSLTFQAEAWEQAMQWLQYANDEKAASSCRVTIYRIWCPK